MNKTRNTLLLVMAMLATILLSACSFSSTKTVRGSGEVVEETRNVSGISGVELATIGRLTVKVGAKESLRIEAEDNLIEYFKTEVSGETLRIGHRGRIKLDNSEPVNYYLTVISLDNIKISSAGDIRAPDLEATQFSINIGSSGNLKMGELNADSLEVNIGSAGNVDITGGQVKTQNVTINSSGDYTAEDLKSDDAEVRINSAGKATVWVKDSLVANLQSSGNLHLRGNPKVDSTMNSSGRVKQISE